MRYKNLLLKPVSFLVNGKGAGHFLTVKPGESIEHKELTESRAEILGLIPINETITKQKPIKKIDDNFNELKTNEAIRFLDQNTRTTISRIKKSNFTKNDIKLLIKEEKKDNNRKKVLDFLSKF